MTKLFFAAAARPVLPVAVVMVVGVLNITGMLGITCKFCLCPCGRILDGYFVDCICIG